MNQKQRKLDLKQLIGNMFGNFFKKIRSSEQSESLKIVGRKVLKTTDLFHLGRKNPVSEKKHNFSKPLFFLEKNAVCQISKLIFKGKTIENKSLQRLKSRVVEGFQFATSGLPKVGFTSNLK